MHQLKKVFLGIIAPVTATVRAKRGASSQYCIFPGYNHPHQSRYDDNTRSTEEWQRDVYMFAAEIMCQMRLSTVCDIGCGSAYKLMRYLGDYNTIGFDVEPTVSFDPCLVPPGAPHL